MTYESEIISHETLDASEITSHRDDVKYTIEQLVNSDGTPTPEFMRLWKADKQGMKENNLFLGREAGKWVVKPGSPCFLACQGGITVANGRCYSREDAEAVIARRVKMYESMNLPAERLAAYREKMKVVVEYRRPKFGTPEERAARRAQWSAYAEGRRAEQAAADYRPSRWELNYVPERDEES